MAYGEFAGQGDDTSEGTETVGGMRQGKQKQIPPLRYGMTTSKALRNGNNALLRDDNQKG